MSSRNSFPSGEDSSNFVPSNQGSSPFTMPTVPAGHGTANAPQRETPSSVYEPPSHTPSPPVPFINGAVTANLTTFVNPNTVVGRHIARAEASTRDANETCQPGDPFGSLDPFNRQPADPFSALDPFNAPVGGRGNIQYWGGGALQSSHDRLRLQGPSGQPRLSGRPSAAGGGNHVHPVVGPVNPTVLEDPYFAPGSGRGRGGGVSQNLLRRNITAPAGPRPMGVANQVSPEQNRNLTVPAVSQVPTATNPTPPPLPSGNDNTTQQQIDQSASVWEQQTSPYYPSRVAISTVYPGGDPPPSFHPSAVVSPLFADRNAPPVIPHIPQPLDGETTTDQPQPEKPSNKDEHPEDEHPETSQLEQHLEDLEQLQHQQLQRQQQQQWELEKRQRQQQLLWQQQHQHHQALLRQRHEQRLQQWQQQRQRLFRSPSAPPRVPDPSFAAPVLLAPQRWSPGGGHFYYRRNGDVVRPAPLADPFATWDGGSGNAMIQPDTRQIYFPPPREMPGRLGRRQERRRALRDAASPTRGAYDAPSGREGMLGEGMGVVEARPLPDVPTRSEGLGSKEMKKKEEE